MTEAIASGMTVAPRRARKVANHSSFLPCSETACTDGSATTPTNAGLQTRRGRRSEPAGIVQVGLDAGEKIAGDPVVAGLHATDRTIELVRAVGREQLAGRSPRRRTPCRSLAMTTGISMGLPSGSTSGMTSSVTLRLGAADGAEVLIRPIAKPPVA